MSLERVPKIIGNTDRGSARGMNFRRAQWLRTRAILAIASVLLSLAGLVLHGSTQPVQAYNLTGCSWSGMPIYYVNASGAYNNYWYANESAAGNWTNTPTNVWLIRVTRNQNVSLFDQNDGNNGYAGWANWWCPFGNLNAGYADAHSNRYYTDGYSQTARVSNMTHEIGHDLGLDHNNPSLCNGVPIMYYNMDRYFTCGIYTPQTDDINGVRSLYG